MDVSMVPLGELTLKIGSGATPRGGKESYKAEGIALFRSLNVYDLQFDASGLAYIDDEQALQLANVEVLPGDVLLNITGASVARCALAPAHLLPARVNQHVAILRPNPRLLDGRFLNYVLVSPMHKGRLLAIAQGGATREALTKRTLEQFDIPVPPLPTQRKIAGVLAAYDELIENNLKRIEILEEMAQGVYREWFVNFRFPGHEDVLVVDSPVGPIPEGWELAAVDSRFQVSLGGTPPRNRPELWNGDIPWINSGSVNDVRVDAGVEFLTDEAVRTSNTKLWPRGTTLIAITGATLGQVSRLEIDACANQSVVGVWDPHGHATDYLYYAIQDRISHLISRAGGAAQQHINKGIVSEFPLLLPESTVIEAFGEVVGPMNTLLANLLRQNVNSRRTRDLLLPRLVSGAIDVSDLEIDTDWLAS